MSGDLDNNNTLFGPRQSINDWWAGDNLLQWLPNSGEVTTVTGSFTLNAVLQASRSSSFTLDADLKKTQAGSFTLDSILRVARSGSFTLDADLFKTTTATFALNAVLFKTTAGSFTLDAVITAAFNTVTGSFTLDAIMRATRTGSLTLDAVLRRTVSGSVTLDAILRRSASGSFTLDARLAGHFTLDAAISLPQTRGFLLRAVLFKTTSASFTLNAVLRSVTRTFTLNAILRSYTSFTLDAQIAFGPVPPDQVKKAFVRIDNVDYSNDIIFADAEFTMQVNGQAGTARFRVRDLQHIYSFNTGDPLAIFIGDVKVWGGFITKVTPGYAFKADDTTNPTLTEKIWVIEGVDYNILFSKRFIINKAHPNQALPIYPGSTFDSVMVLDLVSKFLTLEGDGIDTGGVTHVGTVAVDQDFNPGNPGDAWGAAMNIIAKPTGAIYYIDPGKVLNYVDDDTPDAPFELSDIPLSPLPTSVMDDFERTVSPGDTWGTGLLGEWLPVPGSTNDVEVTGSAGLMEPEGWQYVTYPAFGGTSRRVDFLMQWPTGVGSRNVGCDLTDDADTFATLVEMVININGDIEIFDNDFDDTATITAFSPGDIIRVALELDEGAVLAHAKAWLASDPEPDWQVEIPSAVTVASISITSVFNNTSNSADVFSFPWYMVSGEAVTSDFIGYRDMEILLNGSKLVNDAMVWGAGTGSVNGLVTFDRVQDATSIADHGRWQFGEFTSLLYTQAAVDRRTTSFVYGSPQNHRGGKDDALSVTVTIYEPGLVAGQKIRFVSNVFGVDQIIPIRRMILRFPTPNDPEFTVTLSYDVDDPWGDYEFWFPPFNFDPKPPHVIFDPPPLPRVGGTCDPTNTTICGITDDFERTVTSGLGTATCGQEWVTTVLVSGSTLSVDGSGAVLHASVGVSGQKIGVRLGPPIQVPWDNGAVKTMRFQLPNYDTNWDMTFLWSPGVFPGIVFGPALFIRESASWMTWANAAGTVIPAGFWNSSSTYTWTVFRVGGSTRSMVSNGATEYYQDSGTDPVIADCGISMNVQASSTAPTIRILEIDIPEINKCTLNVFDLFDRTTVSGSWGTSTDGHLWEEHGDGEIYVSDGVGVLRGYIAISGHLSPEARVTSSGPWNLSTYSMDIRWQLESAPTSGHVTLIHFGQVSMQTSVASGDTNSYLKAAGGDNVAVDPSFWVDDGDYTIHYEVVNNAAIASLSNGTFTYTATDPTGGGESSTFVMRFQAFLVTGEQNIFVDSINFDYGGKPCYNDCTSTTESFIDEFERGTSSGNWGTPTSGSVAWLNASDNATVIVSGGFGNGNISTTDPDTEFGINMIYNPGVSSTELTFLQTGFTLTSVVTYSPGLFDPDTNVTFNWIIQSLQSEFLPAETHQLTVFFQNDVDLTYPVVSGSNIGGSEQYSASGTDSLTPPSSGTLIYVKWEFDFAGQTSRAKLWWNADEPTSWSVEYSGALPAWTETWMRFIAQATMTGPGEPYHVDWGFIRIVNGVCVPVGGGVGPPSSGYFCETATRQSSSVYSVSTPFQAGTSLVYINGLIQRRGGLLDYTEDPPNGEIVFTGPEFPETTDKIWVCYNVAGSF